METINFNLILQSEFPLNALVLASEALRIANQNTQREYFDWRFVSDDGKPVRATNGMWFAADCSVREMPDADVYLLFEGNLPTQLNSKKLLGQIRSAARHGAVVGGVDTGAFALAEAGIIGTTEGSEVVLHWEATPSFLERYPLSKPKNQIYLVRDKQLHCAGGVATLDLILHLISEFLGDALANEIAHALLHTRRSAETPQHEITSGGPSPESLPHRLIRLMERNLEFPLTLADLADKFGVSERTLARICIRSFGQSPMRLYLNVRLQAARNFLFYDEFSIRDVAMACGFSYSAVFSRAFKRQFGTTPREFRANLRENQNSAVRPELQRMIATQRP